MLTSKSSGSERTKLDSTSIGSLYFFSGGSSSFMAQTLGFWTMKPVLYHFYISKQVATKFKSNLKILNSPKWASSETKWLVPKKGPNFQKLKG